MSLISVIIPIGSFELDRTNLQKIIRSSKGFPCELIFIVDTDENHVQNKLQECCNQLEVHNFKILICTKRNPGSSRNLGILAATGKWIIFCDSDDLLNFPEITSEVCDLSADFDILLGGFELENVKQNTILEKKIENVLDFHWESLAFTPGLWRWIMRREFIQNLTFPELSMGEDQLFLIKVFSLEPSIYLSPKIFYRYRIQGRTSITNSQIKLNDLIEILRLEMVIGEFPNQYNKIKNFMILKQIFTIVKNGNMSTKHTAFSLGVKFLFLLPLKDYGAAFKFVLHIFRKWSKNEI